MAYSCHFEREELQDLLRFSKESGQSSIDLNRFICGGTPLLVSVDNLLDVVAEHKEPKLSLSWDEGTTVSVHKTSGGVIASFELTF